MKTRQKCQKCGSLQDPASFGKRLALQRISNRRISPMGAWFKLHAAKATAIQATIAHRKRVAAVVQLESPPKRACGPHGPKDMEHDRIDWDKHFESLNDRDFEKRYRLSKTAFHATYKTIKPLIDTYDESMAFRSSAGPIRGEVRLAATVPKWRPNNCAISRPLKASIDWVLTLGKTVSKIV